MTLDEWQVCQRYQSLAACLPNRMPERKRRDRVYQDLAADLLRLAPPADQSHLEAGIALLEDYPSADPAWRWVVRTANENPRASGPLMPLRAFAWRAGRQGIFGLVRDLSARYKKAGFLYREIRTTLFRRAAGLIRDAFPFPCPDAAARKHPAEPPPLRPEWVTATTAAVAGGVLRDRAYDRLPILADALEDAGCDRADVLTHLRGPGPHGRACWVLRLALVASLPQDRPPPMSTGAAVTPQWLAVDAGDLLAVEADLAVARRALTQAAGSTRDGPEDFAAAADPLARAAAAVRAVLERAGLPTPPADADTPVET